MVAALKERRRRGPRPARQITSAIDSSSSPKRKHLTYYDKLGVLDFCRSNPHLSQSEVAQQFQARFPGITQATISRYLTQEQEIRRYVADFPQRLGYTRPVHVTLPIVDAALGQWVNKTLDDGRVHLTGQLICEQARQLHQNIGTPDSQPRLLKFSSGWLRSFKDRMGLRRYWYHGEAASAPVDRIDPEILRLQPILSGYALRDVYDFDETALWWRAAPREGLSNRPIPGIKIDKSRLTYGLCTNVDGSDKRDPFILGKTTKPRCFKGRTGPEHGFDYNVNPTAWMTEIMWHRWLSKFDADMRRQNRHVLLLCDNASSHKKPQPGQYPNVRVEFLAAGLTAFLQPLDAGIIRCFKAHYRRAQVQRALQRANAGETNVWHIDQLEAMHMAQAAWNAVSATTIRNCWHHTRICPPSFELLDKANTDDLQDVDAVSHLQSALDQLTERHPEVTSTGELPVSANELIDSDRHLPTESELLEQDVPQPATESHLVS